MKKFMNEFKEFAMKGSVVDMAVGVIIGGAFGKIISSLVEDIIMPALSAATNKVNLADLAVVIVNGSGSAIEIKYGMFLQNVVDFLIIALCIFAAVKLINAHKNKPDLENIELSEPTPSKEELLLTEIRDILRENHR